MSIATIISSVDIGIFYVSFQNDELQLDSFCWSLLNRQGYF